MKRYVAIGCATAAFLLLTSPASADTKERCLDAYASAQRLSRAASLTAAKRELLICAREPCAEILRRDCVSWLEEVEKRMPSVVVEAHTTDGQPVLDATLVVDERGPGQGLDGRAMDLDPGEHSFRLVRRGHPDVSVRRRVREAEKAQRVDLDAGAAATAPVTAPAREVNRPVPWTAWAAAGVATVATGSFAYFALQGRAQEIDRLGPCRGHCPDDLVDSVQRKYVIADVALGVGVVALGLAAYFYLTRPAVDPSPVARNFGR